MAISLNVDGQDVVVSYAEHTDGVEVTIKFLKSKKIYRIPELQAVNRTLPAVVAKRKRPGTNPPKDEERAVFGQKIANARIRRGLTQRELAAMLGISQSGLCNIERGVTGGGPRSAIRDEISKFLRIR